MTRRTLLDSTFFYDANAEFSGMRPAHCGVKHPHSLFSPAKKQNRHSGSASSIY